MEIFISCAGKCWRRAADVILAALNACSGNCRCLGCAAGGGDAAAAPLAVCGSPVSGAGAVAAYASSVARPAFDSSAACTVVSTSNAASAKSFAIQQQQPGLRRTKHDHAHALLLGLRPPLRLESLSIDNSRPLKFLQQVDAQQLTALTALDSSTGSAAVQALATELGRLSKLQLLFCGPMSFIFAELCFSSSLAQLTDLRCMPQLQALEIMCEDDDQDPAAALHALQALQAMCSLQRLELEYLRQVTPGPIASIAQASSLTSLQLEFNDSHDPVKLDLSAFTALQQLRDLNVCHRCPLKAPVAVATFGHSLTHLPLLNGLTLCVALHDLALAQNALFAPTSVFDCAAVGQVWLCTQLTALKLRCWRYSWNDCVDDDWPHFNEDNELYHVPGCFQFHAIAIHLTQLQLLCICICPRDKLVAILNSPWLPHLKQLELSKHYDKEVKLGRGGPRHC
eukprot:gene6004-biopygen7799